MLFSKRLLPLWSCLLLMTLAVCGCSFLTPAKKPEIGPAGKSDVKTNPPFVERFKSPPYQFYDMEAAAGIVFYGINTENWPQAEAGLHELQAIWQEVSPLLGDEKKAKKAGDSINKLSTAISTKKITASYEALNTFMGNISDIGKAFKLSPLSDIIGISNLVRNVSFYVEEKNWVKAASKVKELADSWGQVKPGMESIGILGDVTKTHSYINQLKDAVNAENKSAAENTIESLNECIGTIREFYRGK